MYFWNSEWTSFFRTASSSYSEISFTSDISRRMHRVHSDVQKSETIPLHRPQYIGYFSPILARKKSVGAYEGPCESFDESNQNAHQFCKVGKSCVGECNLECCRFTSLVGGDFTEDIDMPYSLRKFLRFFLSCFFSVSTTRPFQMVNDLNECVMESALPLFTKLIGLHIVGCPKIDHVAALQLTFHVPLLESLSLTTSVSCRTRILQMILNF